MIYEDFMDKKYSESELKLVIYYQENRKWLDELARHGDTYIRAMALTIIKNARDILDR